MFGSAYQTFTIPRNLTDEEKKKEQDLNDEVLKISQMMASGDF